MLFNLRQPNKHVLHFNLSTGISSSPQAITLISCKSVELTELAGLFCQHLNDRLIVKNITLRLKKKNQGYFYMMGNFFLYPQPQPGHTLFCFFESTFIYLLTNIDHFCSFYSLISVFYFLLGLTACLVSMT